MTTAPGETVVLPPEEQFYIFPPGDLFLVVKLEKVLQGDLGEAIEPYIKEERNVEKVRAAALDACK